MDKVSPKTSYSNNIDSCIFCIDRWHARAKKWWWEWERGPPHNVTNACTIYCSFGTNVATLLAFYILMKGQLIVIIGKILKFFQSWSQWNFNISFWQINVPGTNVSCVTWDFDLQDWTRKGCTTDMRKDGIIACSCNHLTNFAVLVVIGRCKRDPHKLMVILRLRLLPFTFEMYSYTFSTL